MNFFQHRSLRYTEIQRPLKEKSVGGTIFAQDAEKNPNNGGGRKFVKKVSTTRYKFKEEIVITSPIIPGRSALPILGESTRERNVIGIEELNYSWRSTHALLNLATWRFISLHS